MSVTNIGGWREVFWDTDLIDRSRTTAELTLHHPIPREVVAKLGEPWEGDGCNSFSIVKDDGLYRMYYLGWEMLDKDVTKHSTKTSQVCCMESTDGLHWVKPDLGICEFGGSRHNNIVMDRSVLDFSDMVHVFIDTNPACPPEERYKAVSPDREKYLSCYISADGLHFTKGWRMTNKGKFDTHNIAFWVPEEQLYYVYVRDFHGVPEDGDLNLGVRDVRWMTSPDFRTWSDPVLLDFGNREDYPLYTNEMQIYERAPHMRIGFPSRYVERKAWTGNYDQLPNAEHRRKLVNIHPRYGLTVTDCVFMTTRDGRHFNRFDEAFMRPGPERIRNWVYGDCYPATGLIETKSDLEGAPDEMSMYVYENHWSQKPTEVRRYTIRKDGFASMSAGYGEKKIVTTPVTFTGSKMELNFSTSARGYVYVTVRACGQEARSCELFGDALDRAVPFEGDLAAMAGKKAEIEFTLRDADVFSYRFFD